MIRYVVYKSLKLSCKSKVISEGSTNMAKLILILLALAAVVAIVNCESIKFDAFEAVHKLKEEFHSLPEEDQRAVMDTVTNAKEVIKHIPEENQRSFLILGIAALGGIIGRVIG